jgi:transcriptional regulator with XRE-family HTH domain
MILYSERSVERCMANELKDVGKRIREAREKKKYSQSELAGLISISNSHMSDIENGKTVLGVDIFMRITEALEVSADWLLRTNVPSVNAIQSNEITGILLDCNSNEVQALIKILKEAKIAIREVVELNNQK